MRLRTTLVLLALFAAGIAALWWTGDNLPTAEQQRETAGLILPGLRNTPTEDVRRLEIVYPGRAGGSDKKTAPGRLVVERRELGAWQLVEPVDASADPAIVETLARNLQALRESPDAGTIEGDPAPYGLDTPVAVLSVFGRDLKSPVATLDVGKTVRDRVYVRPRAGPKPGIEVVDARLLAAVSLPVGDWRDKALFHMPSFRVAGVAVKEGTPPREVEVRRDERHWRMVRPVKAPADDDKTEGLVAELAALRVADGSDGFVADGVRDPAAYGLDAPSMTITLTPFGVDAKPQTLLLGKAVPDKPGQVYARRGDQDDVVRVEVKTLREAYPEPNALRSQKVADFVPSRVTHVRVDALGTVFDLAGTPERWELVRPTNEQADTAEVQSLIARLAELKTSEFLDPSTVVGSKLDPALYRIRVWQSEPGAAPAAPKSSDAEPPGELRFDLRLGRNDALKKAVYGRLEGDPSVLVFPNNLFEVLPKTEFAFRNRTAVSFDVGRVRTLTVERPGKTVTVEAPGSNAKATRWRLVEPVNAPAEESTVAALVFALSQLRVERWESADVGDGKAFGLDAPRMRIRWTFQASDPADPKRPKAEPPPPSESRTLRIGKAAADKSGYYANIEGDPRVFSLSETFVSGFEAELRDALVLKLTPAKVGKIVLRWPSRTLSLQRVPDAPANAPAWKPEPGNDAKGVDLARLGPLVDALAGLKTPNYFQYKGKIPEDSGLTEPRLSLQFWQQGGVPPVELRVGKALTEVQSLATTSTGAEGPVFVIPTVGVINDLIKASAGGPKNEPGATKAK